MSDSDTELRDLANSVVYLIASAVLIAAEMTNRSTLVWAMVGVICLTALNSLRLYSQAYDAAEGSR